ncbi:GNAT family N-acetyltransferase [Methyloceanibacter caenitepidi]|uniref:Acetyltransferase n=1 Tax=Methyloceanibacter caenitepidi TaxID=1384459 RepID=A0A0A8K6E8_9HYPH|nr:GNAT family N-acetyltransferase [Methyloceanibacter caenitepidi]BAQ17579.1 acetyltransferase [Methyloceanibacter caenitepidi]
MALEPTFRPATLADAADLAVLADIAANGLANRIWLEQAGPGQSALEVGRQSVRRPEEVVSYSNATIAMVGTEIAGCLIGGLPEDLYDVSLPDEKPDYFRPVAQLAIQAPGTWYIDVIASYAEFRGYGLGSKLLAVAASKATETHTRGNSLVVGSWNTGAQRLYARCGFKQMAREPAILPESYPQSGDWILMQRPLT